MDVTALALPLLVALIAVALAFDFLNGMHDAANSIATIVSTRVLRPQYAVALGGVLQFHRLPVLRAARRRDRRHAASSSPTSSTRASIFGALTGAIVWKILITCGLAFRRRARMR